VVVNYYYYLLYGKCLGEFVPVTFVDFMRAKVMTFFATGG
jgi:hypothetical protein